MTYYLHYDSQWAFVSWRAGSTQRYVTGQHTLVVLIGQTISLAMKVKDPRTINGYDMSTVFSQ